MSTIVPPYPAPGANDVWGQELVDSLEVQSSRPVSRYAIVEYAGALCAARRVSDGSIISESGDVTAVINAALTDATRKGVVELDCATVPIAANQQIVPTVGSGLIGRHTYDRHTNAVYGTVLQATGTWTSTNAVIRTGVTGTATEGIVLEGIAVDGASKCHTVHTLNCTDLRIINCTLIRGTDKNVWIESTLSPDDGGVATKIQGCMIRTTAAGGTGLYVAGTGATDGILTATTVLNNTVGIQIWGGWNVTGGCHITGNSSSTANILIGSGATQVQIVGNYLDSAGSGANLVCNGHSHTITSNQIFNHGTAASPATLVVGIALNGDRNTIGQNTFRMTDCITGHGIQKDDNTVTGFGGTYGPNNMTTDGSTIGECFAYANGTAVPATNTGSLWIQGNIRD